MARLFSKKRASSQHGGRPRYTEDVVFDAYGVTDPYSTAANLTKMLADLPEALEHGAVGGQYDSTAGDATLTITVPSGKYWRLVGFGHRFVADATEVARYVVVAPSDATPTAFDTITFPAVSMSESQSGFTLFQSGYADVVGDAPALSLLNQRIGTPASAVLTMATAPSNAETVTVGGVTYTFLTVLVDAVNNVLIGINVAASKANLLAAITAVGGTPGTTHFTNQTANPLVYVPGQAWAANLLTCTCLYPGEYGNDLAVSDTLAAANEGWGGATAVTKMSGGVDMYWPMDGAYLGPGEKLVVSVTDGVAGDTLLSWLTYLSFDNDPRPA